MYISKTKISYPVTIATDDALIKRNLSVANSYIRDNDFIDSLLESATSQIEGEINQDIAYTNNTVMINDFSGSSLTIPQGNLNQITSILNNDASTLITFFEFEKSYSEFTIFFNENINCALTVNFTTGFDTNNAIPKALKHSIILLTSDLYDQTNRNESARKSLCQQYKLL